MSEDGWLNVWECDTDLDGLKPVEASDKGAKQVEVSEDEDESDNDDDNVSNKKKESGTCNLLGSNFKTFTTGFDKQTFWA